MKKKISKVNKMTGPLTRSPVVDLQEGQVGLGGDLSLLILRGVGVLEKKRDGATKWHPCAQNSSADWRIRWCPEFARHKGGIQEHHRFPSVLTALPWRNIVWGFFNSSNFLAVVVFQGWIWASNPIITQNAPLSDASIKHPKTSALGDDQYSTLHPTMLKSSFPTPKIELLSNQPHMSFFRATSQYRYWVATCFPAVSRQNDEISLRQLPKVMVHRRLPSYQGCQSG